MLDKVERCKIHYLFSSNVQCTVYHYLWWQLCPPLTYVSMYLLVEMSGDNQAATYKVEI